MKASFGWAVAALLAAAPATAQREINSIENGAPIVAAEVTGGNSLTFRLRAPTATKVGVQIAQLKEPEVAMKKGTDGIWTATVGPLPANLYEYAFSVEGAVFTPAFIEVPGPAMTVYDRQDVPHGAVSMRYYTSAVQGRDRRLFVYLPPQYFTEPTRRFPVAYLFTGMLEDQWTGEGRANFILDNLIAAKKAVPMILVMPNNTTGPVPVPALQNAAVMEKEMVGEIMPMIERDYRTVPDRDHRAIAGISFGGGTAFTLGMRHLDTFGYVGEFSTGTFGGAARTAYAPGYVDYNPDNITPNMYAKLTAPATKPHVLFMSIGTDDPRNPYQKKALAAFRDHGIQPVFREYPGGHEFKVFRPSLVDFAPLLFK